MDFTYPKHFTTGVLDGDDLRFFYNDIGLDNLQDFPIIYDWDSVVAEFEGQLDIDVCTSAEINEEPVQNKIRFTLSIEKDNGSKPAAFFRHLRNAFAHYKVVREGDNYILTDKDKGLTMSGMVNAELLKKFCFRLFDTRERLINDETTENQTTENQ